MLPVEELVYTLFTVILIGINLTLLLAVYQNIKKSGNMRVSIGGVGVLAILSSGCPSCGFSILSLLGSSTGAFALTLQHPILKISIMMSLCVSILYNLKKLQQGMICKIPLTREE